MHSKFNKFIPIIILVLIASILSILNYSPGTFLSGWDTLHPEFNFGLAFERAFYGAFRVEQGLGAVAGHSHMADIPRILLLYIQHFFLPLSFLRYSYVFLSMILGTLGMYFFLDKHVVKNKNASFLGALFYLLNIGTLQTFNVPFEMFTTLFATLPFMFYFAYEYLLEEKGRTRNLFLFTILALINSPSAYAATLWYVLFLCFAVYFFILSLVNRRSDKKSLKHFFILISTLLVVNLFWLVPNIYFVLNHGSEVAHANINRLFSDQAFLKNKEFGNISDILLLKSFYFDWNIYNGNGVFGNLLSPWINHFKDVKVLLIGYLFGAGFILGAFYSFKKLKEHSLPLFAVLAISLFFLINDNFPISFLFNFFQNHIPFFKEALRFPDNKILNIYVFLVSVFFGFAALFIIKKLEQTKLKFKIETIFTLIVSALIVYYSLPSFSGNFINSYMRVKIPDSYFKLFSYLNTQPSDLRVANLPIHSPWGWVYYDWGHSTVSPSTVSSGRPNRSDRTGYQGAGFLYFGIKQPLLDRDFDRWSPYNESYYREMSYAIYKEDKNLLINVINKYKIGFILIDKNVIDPQNPKSVLYFDESKKLLGDTGLVSEYREFGNLELFKLRVNTDIVAALNTNINAYPKTTSAYNDYAFSLFGNYVTEDSPNAELTNVFFPFRNLIDNQSRLHGNILSIDSEKITLKPYGKVENFKAPPLSDNLNLIPTDLLAQRSGNTLTISLYPNTPIFDQSASTNPIKANLTVANLDKNLAISVNQNELFNTPVLPENTPVSIGKVLLKNSDNVISVFNLLENSPVNNLASEISPFFSSCASGGLPPQAEFSGTNIKLTGKGDICILLPYKFFSDELRGEIGNVLTNLQFEFMGNANITSCLFDLETSKCMYYRDPVRQNNFVSFPYVLPLNSANKTAMKITIQSQNEGVNSYLLSNLNATYAKSVADLNLSKQTVSQIFKQNVSSTFSNIYLPKNIIYDSGFLITKIQRFTNDCKSTSSVVKKEIVMQNGVEAIKYTSAQGSFCDHFSYPNLPHSQGYLVVIESKNQEGLPLSVCVNDYTSRKCDIYSDLTISKTFKKDVILLPPMDEQGLGYDVNFENLGIKGSPSVNYLSSVEFIPIPYGYIQKIQVVSPSTNTLKGQVENVTEYNPLFYVVQTNNEPMVLSLNLSYEKGFKAYRIDCSGNLSCLLKGFFAPFYAKGLTNHVPVNNWANGWIVDNVKCSADAKALADRQNSNVKCKYAIIFLPQYFEYLGFILIIITFSLILWHHKTRN